ncbi:hypothetical protein ACTPEO_17715 [Clostridioides difficile]
MSVEYGVCEINGLMRVDYLQNSRLGLNSTVAHEYIHSVLTQSTSYGQFLGLMQIISKIDNNYLDTFKSLNQNMLGIQEITALTIEYLLNYKLHGKEEFNSNTKILKLENEKYYKYLQEFNFLINEDRIDTDTKISIVFAIGRECLNINLMNIDSKLFKKNKIKKHIIHQDNSLKYLPNTRFRKIIKELKEYLSDNKGELSMKDIENIIYSDSIPTISENDNCGTNVIQYVRKITRTSKHKNEINKLLNKMKVVTKDITDPYSLQIMPLNDNYKKIKKTYDEYLKLNFKVPTVIFCGLDISKEDVIYALKKNTIPNLNNMYCTYTSIETKTDYIIDDLDLVKILNDKDSKKVIDLHSYFNLEHSPLALLKEEELYVMGDITYIDMKTYYSNFIQNNYSFRVMFFEKFNAVIINIEENINLIILMDEMSYLTFVNDISNETCNFTFINTDENNPYDKVIIKDGLDEDIYNLIINAYLKCMA